MLAIGAAPLAAQVRPQPGAGNPHLQTVDYAPGQVVRLSSAPGYQLTVGLAPDERIVSVAIGDRSAWQVSMNGAGDHLFLKPLKGGVSTNMTVMTTTRSYAFDLEPLSAPTGFMAYSVDFRYPDAGGTVLRMARPPRPLIGWYKLHGDHALRPRLISDDGEHTFITWPKGAALPATYYRDPGGGETLANGHMRGGVYVIDSVHARLVFRLDGDDASAERYVPRPAK